MFSHIKVGGDDSGAAPAVASPKISYGDADLVLGCDLVVTASMECLSATRPGKTSAVVNGHLVPTGAFQLNPDLELSVEPMHAGIENRIGPDKVSRVDATGLAQALLGDSIGANMLMVGYAAQKGLLPVRVESIEKALDLNGVAVDLNRKALDIGCIAAHDPAALSELLDTAQRRGEGLDDSLEAFIERRITDLTQYQDATYADRYRRILRVAGEREAAVSSRSTALTRAIARYLFKLMAYKDEYEVARLHTDGELMDAISAQFEGEYRLHFHLAPPILPGRDSLTGIPVKRSFGPWMYRCLKVIANLKTLRGTPWDLFGYSAERRMERKLRDDYIALVEELVNRLSTENLDLAVRLAEVPERIRGFGHVKRTHVERAKQIQAELKAEFDGVGSTERQETTEMVP